MRVALVELDEVHLDEVAAIEAAASQQPWSRSLFAGELLMPAGERHWLVALVDTELVGFGGMMIVGDEAHLMNIAVRPTRRRSGIAGQLLTQLIADVVERGACHLTLEVRTDNVAALELYRRYDFESAGERKDYYGQGVNAAILWVHDIDQPGYLAGLHRHDDNGENP